MCSDETCDGTACGGKCPGHEEYDKYIDYRKDVFKDKRALFIGDSICAATARHETNTENRGWPGRIEYSTQMECVNGGISGASLSTVSPAGGVSTKRILTQYMGVKDQDFDFIIMEGGINDAMGSAAVGNITTSFNVEDFNVDTYAGALEELFYYVTQNHASAKLGYMFTFKTPNLHTGRVDHIAEYYDVAKRICEKWNVPFLNMYEDETLNAEMKVDTNECLPDWLHPNTAGYDVLYKYIMYWMETLPVYSEIEEGYELETMPADVLPTVPEFGCSGSWTGFY
jgi:lysophospholipase L1-like esterase